MSEDRRIVRPKFGPHRQFAPPSPMPVAPWLVVLIPVAVTLLLSLVL